MSLFKKILGLFKKEEKVEKEAEEKETPGTATSKSLKNPSKKEIENPSFRIEIMGIFLKPHTGQYRPILQ